MVHDPHIADPDQYLRLDAVETDLKGRSVRSGMVKIGAQGVQFILGVGATMILARLLTPADFGLLAMVGSLMVFIDSISDFGLPMATVYRQALYHEQVSALFWLNVALTGGVVLFMGGMGPVLAWFYGEDRLTMITAAMAGGVLAAGLSVQHESLLMRQMRFGTLSLIEVGALFAGTVAAIVAAVLGAGYWALVLLFVVTAWCKSAAAWVTCGWRPARYRVGGTPGEARLRPLLSYGGDLIGYRLLDRYGQYFDRILIGYFSGAGLLGLYDKAFQLAFFPIKQLYTPLVTVAVAGLSRTRHDPDAYRAYSRQGLLPLFSVAMPVLAFVFVEARAAILVLLGEQWLGAVPFFRLLCLAAFMVSMSKVTKWLYLSQGQTRRQLRWALVATPVLVAAVAVGMQWGALGVATGFAAATTLLTYPAIAVCLKTSPLSMRDFGGILWRPAVAALGAALLLFVSGPALPEPGHVLLELSGKVVLYGLAYVGLWIGMPGGKQAAQALRRILAELRQPTPHDDD